MYNYLIISRLGKANEIEQLLYLAFSFNSANNKCCPPSELSTYQSHASTLVKISSMAAVELNPDFHNLKIIYCEVNPNINYLKLDPVQWPMLKDISHMMENVR